MSTAALEPPRDSVLASTELWAVLESTLAALLGMTLEPLPGDSVLYGSSQLAGAVHIAGAWNGTVLLACSEPLGRRAASLMLGVPPESVALTDVHDALAELTNIVGGGIKGLLPSPSMLSLPTVTCGTHYQVHVPRTVVASRLDAICAGEPIGLRLLQSSAASTPPPAR